MSLIPLDCLTKAQLLKRARALTKEVSRLKHEMITTVDMTTPDSTEPEAEYLNHHGHFRIYIVWTVGTYGNGVKHLDIRAITTSEPKARLYSKILRRDKDDWGDTFERVVIEPRVANHLYAAKLREYMINTGQM